MLPSLLMAEPITLSRAKQIAKEFVLFGQEPTLVKPARGAKVQQRILKNDEQHSYYVFDRGNDGGFVIVSGNSTLPEVIGYTETGSFDYDNMPPALQDMLAYYAEAAEKANADAAYSALTDDESATRLPRKAAGTRNIGPLMTTHWHQSWPYNLLCPRMKSDNSLAATGCVATATSQIIYYWHKDLNNQTKQKTPTYEYGDAPAKAEFQIPSGTPLKWDLMKTEYSGKETSEWTEAVATLMATVGMSGWLTYGSSTSGQISDQVNVMANQFGMAQASCVWKDSYSQESWEKMIVQELEAGHPILYSGVHPTNGGHAVVVDGYQAITNKFHFNFGWGAGNGYDGYYTVDDAKGMNGFNEYQGMVYKIQPKKTNLSATIMQCPDTFQSRVANTIRVKVTNNGTLPYSGIWLFCTTGTTLNTASSKDATTVINPGETKELEFSYSPTAANKLNVYITDADKNLLDKRMEIPTEATVCDLTFQGFAIDDAGVETVELNGEKLAVHTIYNSKKVDVTARFTNSNEATRCRPTIKGLYAPYNEANAGFTSVSTKTKSNVNFERGGSENVTFDLSALQDNTIYRFTVARTASTNKSYDIHFTSADTVVYFKLVGADLAATVSEDGIEATLKGHFNQQIFNTLNSDERVSRYMLQEVIGLKEGLSAANKNALFYTDAAQQVSGTNVITDGVATHLDLTVGYNFQPVEDFVALDAVYHADHGVGKYAAAVLPFDAQVPTGMYAHKVNEVKTFLSVDEKNDVMKAGTPYIILSGRPIDITATRATVSTHVQSEGAEQFQGTYVNMEATDNQYYIDEEATQNFAKYTGNVIPALTGYLQTTTKTRVASSDYYTREKRARELAATINDALNTLNENVSYSSVSAQNALLEAVKAAEIVLSEQPGSSEQSDEIRTLKDAVDVFKGYCYLPVKGGYLDYTPLILNPSFEAAASPTGWTRSSTTDVTCQTINTEANYMSGADGNRVVKLSKTSSLKQKVKNLPNGVYQLVVSTAVDYDKSAYISVTTPSGIVDQYVESSKFGPCYFFDTVLDDIQVTDNELVISFETTGDWMKVDNVRLYQKENHESAQEETSVETMTSRRTGNAKAGIYDLTGRKLSSSSRGIYIIDGRKVVK